MRETLASDRRFKDQVIAKRNKAAQKGLFGADRMAARVKLPLLVELSVVGQIRLRHDSKNFSPVNDDSAVEKFALEAQGRTNEQNRG